MQLSRRRFLRENQWRWFLRAYPYGCDSGVFLQAAVSWMDVSVPVCLLMNGSRLSFCQQFFRTLEAGVSTLKTPD